MAAILPGTRKPGLERLSAHAPRSRVRVRASRHGFERIDARFQGDAFAPHRHDTYTIGVTMAGVQEFGYRGEQRRSLPGHVFVLHPDELHDGHAGSEGGYAYRTLYVAPALIQAALGGVRLLPFVRDAVTRESRLRAAILAALDDGDGTIDDLHFDQILLQLAEALAAHDGAPPRRMAVSPRAVQRAREFLDENLLAPIASTTLEHITGLSRFALTRQFRACLGTSPHRYVVQRRLARAKELMERGSALVDAATESGFADQSHMTRHFRKTYGVSPGRWRAMVAR